MNDKDEDNVDVDDVEGVTNPLVDATVAESASETRHAFLVRIMVSNNKTILCFFDSFQFQLSICCGGFG